MKWKIKLRKSLAYGFSSTAKQNTIKLNCDSVVISHQKQIFTKTRIEWQITQINRDHWNFWHKKRGLYWKGKPTVFHQSIRWPITKSSTRKLRYLKCTDNDAILIKITYTAVVLFIVVLGLAFSFTRNSRTRSIEFNFTGENWFDLIRNFLHLIPSLLSEFRFLL